ncbi:retinol dehydrogenase 7-like [Gigantopelta aegis]|uniref:retinol dehydrogenase 7-like n=1 Tax=Gigantopelta aegis TaxID=1735272 RepID=UPI001B88992E|nr:retinol dehydrogenase 7-like [Gigantopelta aegis]
MLVAGILLVVVVYILVRWLLGLPRVGDYGDKYVFITGCDTGFGNLLARRLDKMGFHVFAACFTREGADDLQKATSSKLLTVSPVDITSAESIENAHRFVVDHLPEDKGLWAIVNNAGVGGAALGPLEWHRRDVYIDILAVNLLGMVDVTRIFLPLVRKCQGRIVNMSSMAGRLAAVGNGLYSVSKFAVEGYSDCLRSELYRQGISVCMLEPSGFRTPLVDYTKLSQLARTAFSSTSPAVQRFYGKRYVDKFCESVKIMVDTMVCDDLNRVIDCYVHAITAKFPRARYNPGNWTVTGALAMLLLPTWMSDWIHGRLATVPEPDVNESSATR